MNDTLRQAPRQRWLLLALVLLAYSLRVIGLDRQSLWRDEVDAIYFAVRNLEETLAMFTASAQNGPLYFLLLRPWFWLVGTGEFALRYLSVFLGTASVPLLWQVAQQLAPEREEPNPTQQTEIDSNLAPVDASKPMDSRHVLRVTWQDATRNTQHAAPLDHLRSPVLIAAALLAISPYMVWYGQEGKMYAAVTFLALLASWCWLRGVLRGGWGYWLGYWLTVTAAIYIHLMMVLLLPVHLLWFLIAWPASRQRWRGYALALAGLTLPYLPMALWHWEMLTRPEKLTGFAYTPAVDALRGLALYHSRGFIPATELLWLAPLFFLFIAGLLLGVSAIGDRRAGDAQPLAPARRYALLLTWLLAPVAGILLMSLRQPVFTERYVIWIGPAALLFVALGVQVLLTSSGRLAPWLAALLLVYFVAVWGAINWQQQTATIKYDLRGAVQYLHAARDPADLLILQIPHQEWSYRYYTSDFGPTPFQDSDARLGRWTGGPYTNYGEPDDAAAAAVDAALAQATAGSDVVWVMLSEVAMWDQRGLTVQWLDAHATLAEQRDFAGVQVRRYTLSP
jgi:mannosyltransferase